MFIAEVIGVGEVAIADARSREPSPDVLAQVVVDAHNGGMLTDKAGVTHFHVGTGNRRLQCLRDLIESTPDINPEWLYPTHINRSEKLIVEAVAFTKRNCFVDHKYKLEEIWPLVSKNTAHILKFRTRGEIKPGFDSSFLILNSKTFEIDHVVSRGRFMVREGRLCVKEKFLEESNRRISLIGNKA